MSIERWASAMLLATLLAGPGVAAAEGAEWRYAAGSRINLRAQPQAGAPVVAVLDINARLQLLRRSGAWCEVRLDTPEARQGHVACELLATQPLKLEDVEAQHATAPAARRVELSARAFWLSPSLERWERHGGALEGTLSEQARFDADPASGLLKRPPMAEFEAMKSYLASGRMRVESPRRASAPAALAESTARVTSALTRLPLPAAAPSFFGADDLDALVPSGWVMSNGNVAQAGAQATEPEPYSWANTGDELRMLDAMSRRFGARMKATPSAGAFVNRVDQVEGVWGVGAIRVQFAPAAAIETMTGDGRLRSLPVVEVEHAWGSDGCMRRPTQILKPPRPRGAPGLDGLLLAWVGRKPAASQASVASRQRDGKRLQDRLVVHVVDIDGDKRPDFVVYEGRYRPQVSATGLWKVVFANVAGQWRQVYLDQDDDCT